MSAVSGYSTPFSSIADYHQDLNINGASESEYVFMSGTKPENLMPWSAWREYVLFNKTYELPSVVDDQLKRAIAEQNKKLPMDSTVFNTPTSCYDVVAADPRLSRMKWLLDYVGYGKVRDLDYPITLFAPINDKFDDTLDYPLNYGVKMVSMLQVLRYHILPYKIHQWQLENRRLRLRTDLDLQHVETDFTNGRKLLLNPISTRELSGPEESMVNGFGDPIASLPDSWFPKKDWQVDVLGWVDCDGGTVIIIDRPLVFPGVL